MKNQILQNLSLSLVPDTATSKSVTSKLLELSKQPSYCISLMEIIDDQSQAIPIRQASLVQLKNTVRKYWSANDNEISQSQKNAMLEVLFAAFVRSSFAYPLLKLYKEVVAIIVGFAYKTWLPIELICNGLLSQQNPIPVLHFILAVESNFELSIHQEEHEAFSVFIKSIFPSLLALVQKNSNEEIIYLIMKIIWKIVHYEVKPDIKTILCGWMDLILSVAGASNQSLQAKIEETQQRGTTEFFYFHAKKWATRILYRFIYRHANSIGHLMATEEVKQQIKQFSRLWYETYGQRVVDVITQQFMYPTIVKTRFFQMKCLTGLINHHPQEMKKFSELFQYKILPPYMQITREDEEMANSEPMEFINREEELCTSFTYLKKEAKDAWIAFTNIGAKKKKKGKEEQIGVLFNENMNWIRSKLDGNNPLEKEMAMYLICQLRSSIKNSDIIKKILPNLINQYVVPEFISDIMFLRARSMQIFDQYGDLFYDKSILKKAVEGIYFCLTGDSYPLVRLKAASAFHVLLQHEDAREEVKPLFKQILEIYLILLEKYDSESLVFSLTGIVEHFSVEVGPYACELMKYLSKHFIKLFQKDKSQAQNDPEYDGETELAASGVLNTMRILLQSGIDKQNIVKMQSDVLDVCDYVFCSNDVDYIEDVLSVLRAYTHRAPAITQRLLFYYMIIIYYVSGISESQWQKIPQMQISDLNKKCLQTVKSGCNIQSIDSAMLVLRNYIAIDTSILMRLTDPFGVNLLELLFNMVGQIYQKGPNQFDGEVEMNSSTMLMGYLLENNYKKWDDIMLTHIWQIAKYNLARARSKVLKAINTQLLCLFFWNNTEKTLALAQTDNLLVPVLTCILNSESKIKFQHERQRVILGLSELMAYPAKPQEVVEYLPKLFTFTVNLVKKNCDFRINEDCSQNYETESEDEEDENANINDIVFGEDEPEDIWDEDYENNYSSKLDEVDEIKLFKDSVQRLMSEQPQFYSQLISQMPVDQLSQLDEKVKKAIEMCSPQN